MRGLALALALACAAVPALAVRLDDSASPRRRVEARPQWVHAEVKRGDAERYNALAAAYPGVEVRLNTAAYVGKRGRIWLEVPQFVSGLASPTAMRLEWRTRGAFRAGSALPGERALLYDGPITQAMMSETFDFTVLLDARYVGSPLRFDPVFDIDILP